MILKDYQVDGVVFLQKVLEDPSKSSVFLADEMELGKTSKLTIILELFEFYLIKQFSPST